MAPSVHDDTPSSVSNKPVIALTSPARADGTTVNGRRPALERLIASLLFLPRTATARKIGRRSTRTARRGRDGASGLWTLNGLRNWCAGVDGRAGERSSSGRQGVGSGSAEGGDGGDDGLGNAGTGRAVLGLMVGVETSQGTGWSVGGEKGKGSADRMIAWEDGLASGR